MSSSFIVKSSLFLKINLILFCLVSKVFPKQVNEPFFNQNRVECIQVFFISFLIGSSAEVFLNKNAMDRITYPLLTTIFSYIHKGIEFTIDEAQQSAIRIKSQLSFGLIKYPKLNKFNLFAYVASSFLGVNFGQFLIYYLKNYKKKAEYLKKEDEQVDKLLQDLGAA